LASAAPALVVLATLAATLSAMPLPGRRVLLLQQRIDALGRFARQLLRQRDAREVVRRPVPQPRIGRIHAALVLDLLQVHVEQLLRIAVAMQLDDDLLGQRQRQRQRPILPCVLLKKPSGTAILWINSLSC
jgi:hypothetical protein